MIKPYARRKQHAPIFIGWIVTITVILFYAYEYFLRNAPSPMFKYFKSVYAINAEQFGLIDGAYYWTYIPMQIVVGTLMDHYGVRKPLFLAILSCIVGSILYSIDNNLQLVIIGRMLIGFGSAFGFVAVLKTATLWLPKKYFPLAVGIATSLGMLGAISSLMVITYLIENIGVNTTFEVSELTGIGLLLMSYFVVYDKHQRTRPSHAAKRFRMMKLTVKSVITNSQIWLAGMIGLSLYLPTQLFGLWGITYFSDVFNYSSQNAAFLSSLLFWGWIIGSPLVGWIAEYIKNRRIVIIVGALGACCMLYLIIYLPLSRIDHLAAAMLALGVFSSVQILAFDIATSACSRSHAGTAVAITNMIVMFGGPLQSSIGHFIEAHSADTAGLSAEGFQLAFAIMPTLCLLSAFIALLIRDNTQYD